MDRLLTRYRFEEFGIFGELTAPGSIALVTLEHAFLDAAGAFMPAVPAGTYVCARGLHTLLHHPTPFEAFEILNVPGHTKCLFHIGNKNADSEGCVLLGMQAGPTVILKSEVAFESFMRSQDGVDRFALVVKDAR